MCDSWRTLDEETQLASCTGVGGCLEGVAAGEHERHDHGGEVFAEDERNGNRKERDRVDAHIAMGKAARDRPDKRPENDHGCAGPDDVCWRVGTEDVEHRARDEPDQDDEYDRRTQS